MSPEMLRAFSDEIEKLGYAYAHLNGLRMADMGRGGWRAHSLDRERRSAEKLHETVPPAEMAEKLRKEAGMLQNVGTRIVQTAKATPGWLKRQAIETGENLGQTTYKMIRHPIKSTVEGAKDTITHPELGLRTMFRKGSGTMNKVMGGLMVGGTAMGLNDLRKKNDPSGQNRGMAERIGDFAGQTAGGMIGFRHGLSGGLLGSIAGGAVLSRAGRAADKIRSYARPQAAQQQVQPEGVQG